jgi:hypothetical protein
MGVESGYARCDPPELHEKSLRFVVPVGWDESPVRAKREGHQSARFNARELRALVQVNMHAAPITIAKAKTPIATIEPAIMMNQAHMTATDAQSTIASAAQRGKTPKVRKVKCIAHR